MRRALQKGLADERGVPVAGHDRIVEDHLDANLATDNDRYGSRAVTNHVQAMAGQIASTSVSRLRLTSTARSARAPLGQGHERAG